MPSASVTRAVAVTVDLPSATMWVGASATWAPVGAPGQGVPPGPVLRGSGWTSKPGSSNGDGFQGVTVLEPT